MGYNTKTLTEDGYGMCTSCRKKVFVGQLVICHCCDKYVCKSCSKISRMGAPVRCCPTCYSKEK